MCQRPHTAWASPKSRQPFPNLLPPPSCDEHAGAYRCTSLLRDSPGTADHQGAGPGNHAEVHACTRSLSACTLQQPGQHWLQTQADAPAGLCPANLSKTSKLSVMLVSQMTCCFKWLEATQQLPKPAKLSVCKLVGKLADSRVRRRAWQSMSGCLFQKSASVAETNLRECMTCINQTGDMWCRNGPGSRRRCSRTSPPTPPRLWFRQPCTARPPTAT